MQLKALDDRALDHVAAYFRALSEPLRLKILNALRDKVRNVGELTQMLDCSQANVSKHLAVLTRHGFIERSARGTTAFYRIADPRVSQLCDLVCGQWRSALRIRQSCWGRRRQPAARGAEHRRFTRPGKVISGGKSLSRQSLSRSAPGHRLRAR